MNDKERRLISWLVLGVIITISTIIICSNQVFPSKVSDGTAVVSVSDDSGGVIIAWYKSDSIYAQRVDSSGRIQWGEEGLLIVECPSGTSLSIVKDGLGGAIISWYDTSGRSNDRHDPDIYDPVPFFCRRINADGSLMWTDSLISKGRELQVVSDGAGGAFIAWDNYSVYHKGLWDNFLRVQKIAPDGNRLWGNDGILVVASTPFRALTDEEKADGIKGTITQNWPTYSGYHRIVADGSGGVYTFWAEDDLGNEHKIFTQRLDSNGNNVWSERRFVSRGTLKTAEIDGNGNIIIKTADISGLEIYIDSEGKVLKTKENGSTALSMGDGTGGSFNIRIEEDPPYGDVRKRLYIPWIQRLDPSGQPLWEETKALPDDGQKYTRVQYSADGNGGIIIIWVLEKGTSIYSDARTRKLDSNGEVRWSEQGIPVFYVPDIKYQKIESGISDESGGVIITAIMGKSSLRGDMIYVQRMNTGGKPVWGGGIRIDN